MSEDKNYDHSSYEEDDEDDAIVYSSSSTSTVEMDQSYSDQEEYEDDGGHDVFLNDYKRIIREAIEARAFDTLLRALGYVTINMEDQKETIRDFYDLLVLCKEADNEKALNYIITAYSELFGPFTPITTLIYALEDAEEEVLSYLSSEEKLSFSDIVYSMRYFANESDLTIALKNVNLVYQGLRVSDYTDVIQRVKGSDPVLPMMFEEWLRTSSRNFAEFSPIPSYIIGAVPPPLHTDLVLSLKDEELPDVTLEQIVFLRVKNLLDSKAITREEIPSRTAVELDKLEKSTVEEQNNIKKIYSKYLEESSLETNDEYFKIFGPSFPFYRDRTLSSDEGSHPCSKYGGCRMFLCVEFEDEDDEENNRENNPDLIYWFTGSCDSEECAKRIREKHHAVRMPLFYGGWRGCYCSWKCAKSDAERLVGNTSLQLCNSFEKAFEDIGIYDRLWTIKRRENNMQQNIASAEELLQFIELN